MSETITQDISVEQQILNGLDGRTQSWLVDKVKEYTSTLEEGEEKKVLSTFTDVYLSRKMNKKMDWHPYELNAVSFVLKTEIKVA